MKRSEMITQIIDELHHELWGYLAEHSEHDDAVADAGIDLEDLANKVLDRVEQAGMMPPPLEGLVDIEEEEGGVLRIKVWGWEESRSEAKGGRDDVS